MPNMEIFNLMFIIVPVIMLAIITFTVAMIFSPKLRAKMMGKQIKATKYMVDDVKDDLTDIGTTIGNVVANTGKNILDQNEDNLKNISTRMANISKDGIETTVRAIKNGITKDDSVFCKECGTKIDADSVFCSKCGKKQ